MAQRGRSPTQPFRKSVYDQRSSRTLLFKPHACPEKLLTLAHLFKVHLLFEYLSLQLPYSSFAVKEWRREGDYKRSLLEKACGEKRNVT